MVPVQKGQCGNHRLYFSRDSSKSESSACASQSTYLLVRLGLVLQSLNHASKVWFLGLGHFGISEA